MDEFDGVIERKSNSKSGRNMKGITLQKAVDMGEYHPEYLATFPEWHQLSRIMQWQFIRQAIKNRRRFLLVQWAEINNQLDFSQKPYLANAAKNIELQSKKLNQDEEKFQVEYSI